MGNEGQEVPGKQEADDGGSQARALSHLHSINNLTT